MPVVAMLWSRPLPRCAGHDIGVLKLHVFANNIAAVNLYESAGFEATNINMAKVIT